MSYVQIAEGVGVGLFAATLAINDTLVYRNNLHCRNILREMKIVVNTHREDAAAIFLKMIVFVRANKLQMDDDEFITPFKVLLYDDLNINDVVIQLNDNELEKWSAYKRRNEFHIAAILMRIITNNSIFSNSTRKTSEDVWRDLVNAQITELKDRSPS
jgi:hypothetical protein